MNETLIDLESLGVKFEDVAHYSYPTSKYTFCGIPKIELLGMSFPIGGSGKSVCEKCKSLYKNNK